MNMEDQTSTINENALPRPMSGWCVAFMFLGIVVIALIVVASILFLKNKARAAKLEIKVEKSLSTFNTLLNQRDTLVQSIAKDAQNSVNKQAENTELESSKSSILPKLSSRENEIKELNIKVEESTKSRDAKQKEGLKNLGNFFTKPISDPSYRRVVHCIDPDAFGPFMKDNKDNFKKVTELFIENETLIKDVSELNNEISSVQKQLKSLGQEVESENEKISKLKSDSELCDQYNILEKRASDNGKEIDEITQHNEIRHEGCKRLVEKQESLSKEIDKLTLNIRGMLVEIDMGVETMKSELCELKIDLDKHNEINAELSYKKEQQLLTLKGKEEIKSGLSQQKDKLFQENTETIETIAKYEQENDVIKKSNVELESNIKKLERENEDLVKQKSSILQSSSGKSSEIDKLKGQIVQIQEQLSLCQTLKNLELQLNDLNSENEQLRLRISEVNKSSFQYQNQTAPLTNTF